MIILTLARHSFREVIRKRILLVTLLFAVALVATAPLWPAMTDADRIKLVQDISLTAMTFFGIILSVFVAAYSLPSDIDEKRIFTLVTKPVRRHHVFLGKLLGFIMVFAVVIAVMAGLSSFLIRKISTYDRIEITSAEAPLYFKGNEVGIVARGLHLRVLSSANDFHTVLLPDELAVSEAWVDAKSVDDDRTANRVETNRPDVMLTTHLENGHPLIQVPGGTRMSVRERSEGGFLVTLPDTLRIRQVQVRSSDSSTPQRRTINAKRVVSPSRRELISQGMAVHTDERLILATLDTQIGESWYFDDIDATRLPEGEIIPVYFRLTGILYSDITDHAHHHDGSCSHFDHYGEVTHFHAVVEAIDPATGAIEHIRSEAYWADDFFDIKLNLPREMLENGQLELKIESSEPGFINRRLTFLGPRRGATWHFRNMNTRRFPPGDRISGVMQYELFRGMMSAHGGDMAETEFEVISADGTRRETIVVPIRRGRNVEFDFDRSLVDANGNVDIRFSKIPDPYLLGVPYKAPAILLIQRPVSFEYAYSKAVLLIYCQLVLIGSITVAASTFLSGGVAALFGFFIYFTGMMVGFMREVLQIGPEFLAGHHHGLSGDQLSEHTHSITWRFMEVFMNVMIRLMPDVNKLDARDFLLRGLDVPGRVVGNGIGLTLIYSAVALTAAWLIFRRRELG